MNQQEEEQSFQKPISQEEPPSIRTQVIAAFVFFGFILGLPTIIDRLGK